MRKGVMLAIIGLFVAVVTAVLFHFEKGEVSLTEVGILPIVPPSKNAPAVWQSSRGNDALNEIKSVESWLDAIDKENPKVKIHAINFDPKKVYYFGVGCKIEKVSYFKHIYNSWWYHVDSVKRNPIKPYNQIYVYEGDVPVADIIP